MPIKFANRFDGWQNALTGLGSKTLDKRQSSKFSASIVTSAEALELWKSDDLAKRGVELMPHEMTREWFEIRYPGEEELVGELEEEWKNLGLRAKVRDALEYRNAYGGGGIFIGTLDNKEALADPLETERVREITHLTVLEPRELQARYWYSDPTEPNYGEVSHFLLTTSTRGESRKGGASTVQQVLVHESRILQFRGPVVSRYDTPEHVGWGHNIFTWLYDVIRDYKVAWESTSLLLNDFSQVVIRIKDLDQIMAAEDGKRLLESRVEGLMLGLSVLRAVLIDSEEEYQRHTTNITGLHDILREMATRVCAAFEVPMTLFLGTSPGGLNATGESDMRQHYDRVSAMQTDHVIPQLNRLLKMQLAMRGKLKTKEKVKPWSILARPLWQPTEKEVAEVHKIQAEADRINHELGVLTSRNIAESRFSQEEYSLETRINMEEWDREEAEREAEREEMAKAIAEAGANPNNNPPTDDPTEDEPPGNTPPQRNQADSVANPWGNGGR